MYYLTIILLPHLGPPAYQNGRFLFQALYHPREDHHPLHLLLHLELQRHEATYHIPTI